MDGPECRAVPGLVFQAPVDALYLWLVPVPGIFFHLSSHQHHTSSAVIQSSSPTNYPQPSIGTLWLFAGLAGGPGSGIGGVGFCSRGVTIRYDSIQYDAEDGVS